MVQQYAAIPLIMITLAWRRLLIKLAFFPDLEIVFFHFPSHHSINTLPVNYVKGLAYHNASLVARTKIGAPQCQGQNTEGLPIDP